jgi:hypothetical protein
MAPDFERLARTPWPKASLTSSWHQRLELRLGPLMVERGGAGLPLQVGKFRPGVGAAHVDGFWWPQPWAGAARCRTGAGGSPLSTQRQNFLSAVSSRR